MTTRLVTLFAHGIVCWLFFFLFLDDQDLSFFRFSKIDQIHLDGSCILSLLESKELLKLLLFFPLEFCFDLEITYVRTGLVR